MLIVELSVTRRCSS